VLLTVGIRSGRLVTGGCEDKTVNKLRVKCIRCGVEWEKDSAVNWGPSDCSSSLCTACFVEVVSPLIHKKQRLEGNFDCFGKAGCFCDQLNCKYRQWCLANEERPTNHPGISEEQPDSVRSSYPGGSTGLPNSHPW